MSEEAPKISFIQIPNELISDPTISVKATYLYVWLKILYTYKTKIFSKKPEILRVHTQWTNKLINKYLLELKQNKYIDYNFTNLPKSKPIQIKILSPPESEKNGFTQVPKDIITQVIDLTSNILETTKNIKDDKGKMRREKIHYDKEHPLDLKEYAVRLLFVRAKFHRISMENGKSCSWLTYALTKNEMQIRYDYLETINTILHKNEIVNMQRNKNKTFKNEYDQEIYQANQYTVRFSIDKE